MVCSGTFLICPVGIASSQSHCHRAESGAGRRCRRARRSPRSVAVDEWLTEGLPAEHIGGDVRG
jgi:hypothetical protein